MRATATLLAVTLLACSGGDPPDRDPEETTEPDGDTTMPTPMAGDGAPDVAEPMDSVAAPTPIPMTSTAPAPNVDAIFENECATATMQSSLLPSNLLFVLDRSESMACNPPPITTSTQCEDTPERADEIAFNKWEIVRISVSRAMKNLPPETNVGISYFSNDDSCGVHPVPRVPLARLDGAQPSAIDAAATASLKSSKISSILKPVSASKLAIAASRLNGGSLSCNTRRSVARSLPTTSGRVERI